MSIETLLEAAEYLEYRSEVMLRGEEPEDYDTFSLQRAAVQASGAATPTDQCNNVARNHCHHSPTPGSPPPSQYSSKPVPMEDPSSDDAHQIPNHAAFRLEDIQESRSKWCRGSGTREVHNKLEKYRRAHLKECFDYLRKQLPNLTDLRKVPNLTVLKSAYKYIQVLKRKEREYEHEMDRLAREKIANQQRLGMLKKEISLAHPNIDWVRLEAIGREAPPLPRHQNAEHDSNTSTASGEPGSRFECISERGRDSLFGLAECGDAEEDFEFEENGGLGVGENRVQPSYYYGQGKSQSHPSSPPKRPYNVHLDSSSASNSPPYSSSSSSSSKGAPTVKAPKLDPSSHSRSVVSVVGPAMGVVPPATALDQSSAAATAAAESLLKLNRRGDHQSPTVKLETDAVKMEVDACKKSSPPPAPPASGTGSSQDPFFSSSLPIPHSVHHLQTQVLTPVGKVNSSPGIHLVSSLKPMPPVRIAVPASASTHILSSTASSLTSVPPPIVSTQSQSVKSSLNPAPLNLSLSNGHAQSGGAGNTVSAHATFTSPSYIAVKATQGLGLPGVNVTLAPVLAKGVPLVIPQGTMDFLNGTKPIFVNSNTLSTVELKAGSNGKNSIQPVLHVATAGSPFPKGAVGIPAAQKPDGTRAAHGGTGTSLLRDGVGGSPGGQQQPHVSRSIPIPQLAQVFTASPGHIKKMVASGHPILKQVHQIPLMGTQYVAAQSLVKPFVVVSGPENGEGKEKAAS
ncbi:unnamed protein product [Darwinula stevensoni]|uniref:Max-binding protein MNT n=1 Tax=Darwinula stevensoni TaxID=69355 RepID=A0A7R8X8U7_9CRUS|nr:unnamed protein product [Darwinula stevensoni]CAG0888467.1 unnamed protein product [Darwinula stevensoni]